MHPLLYPTKEHLAKSRNIFVCCNWGKSTCISGILVNIPHAQDIPSQEIIRPQIYSAFLYYDYFLAFPHKKIQFIPPLTMVVCPKNPL